MDTTRFFVLPGPFQDRVQRDMEQQNLGHPRPLPLTEAIGKGAKYLSDLFNNEKENKPVKSINSTVQQRCSRATTALILGLLSIVFSLFTGIPAIIIGKKA